MGRERQGRGRRAGRLAVGQGAVGGGEQGGGEAHPEGTGRKRKRWQRLSEGKREKRHAGWHHLQGTGRAAWVPSEGEGNRGLRRETAAAEAAMAAAA